MDVSSEEFLLLVEILCSRRRLVCAPCALRPMVSVGLADFSSQVNYRFSDATQGCFLEGSMGKFYYLSFVYIYNFLKLFPSFFDI